MGFRSGDGLRPSQSVGHAAAAAATSTLDSTNKGRAAGTKYVPISCSLRRGGSRLCSQAGLLEQW